VSREQDEGQQAKSFDNGRLSVKDIEGNKQFRNTSTVWDSQKLNAASPFRQS